MSLEGLSMFDKWQLLMRDVCSPQSYVDFAWYSLVASTLQRRVWTGPLHKPLYPNNYTILVGQPGIGKGEVTRPAREIIKTFKLHNPSEKKSIPDDSQKHLDPTEIAATETANYVKATGGKDVAEPPLTIPIAANATTYEALAHSIAKSIRYINYKKYDDTLQKYVTKIYTHSSLYFCLEEISSLFRKHTEDTVNLLIEAYDCQDYNYVTQTQGSANIRSCCLNFLGGTTPSFMQSTFNDKLLNEGFSSRCWFIFEWENRSKSMISPELDAEQIQCKKDITEHLRQLTTLYGPIKYTSEAWDYLNKEWFPNEAAKRANNSIKLQAYYARKGMHVQKLAMAIHFSETATKDEMGFPKEPIQLATCLAAIKKLDEAEKKMHYAINFDSRNPLAPVARKVEAFIRRQGPQSFSELNMEFFDDAKTPELRDIIGHLISMQKIALYGVNGHSKYDLCDRAEEEITMNGGRIKI